MKVWYTFYVEIIKILLILLNVFNPDYLIEGATRLEARYYI